MILTGDAVPATAEHGRGLKIIITVTGNLQLTRHEREGTTLRFREDTGIAARSAGQYLFRHDGRSQGATRPGGSGNQ